MTKRKQHNRKVWAKRAVRVLKKSAQYGWKLARRVTRRLAQVIRVLWRKTFPRKKKRHRAISQPDTTMTGQSLARIRPSSSPETAAARSGLLLQILTTRVIRLRRRSARFWLGVILLVLALSGTAAAFWRSESREETCVLREHIDRPDIQRNWLAVRKWCPLIMQAARRYQLDPHLIAALILVESAGDPQAYSSSGAVGLMQVMPRDGIAARFQCINGPCFADRPTIAQLQEPAFNVDYGTMLLRSNVDRDGSLRRALRSYGPLSMNFSYADLVLATYASIRP
jgi:hypothetical protein